MLHFYCYERNNRQCFIWSCSWSRSCKWCRYYGCGESLVAGGTAAELVPAALALGAVPFAGWVILAIMAIITAILLGLIYSADSEDRTVTTTCEPWIAPTGGDDCALCDSDPMHPCSQYRCKSLGQNCEFIGRE